MMRKYGDVFVVAPNGPRSGSGMSITSTMPVKNKFIGKEPATDTLGELTVWSCTGTPDDCTKMALEILLPRVPDLVLGGINHGDNCAVNAHYSGTMSIALEGCLKSIPSVAFSSGKTATDADFSYTEKWVKTIVEHLLANGLPNGVCLNVNIPKEEDIKGMRVCKMGMGDWHEEWDEREHPHGGKYYWISGYYKANDPDDQETDTWAFKHGYVAITPVQLDLTAYHVFNQLKSSLEK